MLEQIADEDELQVVFPGDVAQLHRVLMPEHRDFIDHDAVAAYRRLELFIFQQVGDGPGIREPVLLQHFHRFGGGGEIMHLLPGQPHAFVVFGQQRRLARSRPGLRGD